MPSRSSLNVSLTRELERFVQTRVASGRYQTASEVVREGLRLLEQREQERAATLKGLKQRLQRGAAQAERGEVVDGEKFLDKLIGRLERKARKSKAA
jgi:antitoxin ParD1/3/4